MFLLFIEMRVLRMSIEHIKQSIVRGPQKALNLTFIRIFCMQHKRQHLDIFIHPNFQ